MLGRQQNIFETLIFLERKAPSTLDHKSYIRDIDLHQFYFSTCRRSGVHFSLWTENNKNWWQRSLTATCSLMALSRFWQTLLIKIHSLYLFLKNKTKRQPASRRHCGRKYSNHDGCDKETDGTDKGCDKDCHKRNNDDNVEVGVITIIDDNRRRQNMCHSIILNLPALVKLRFSFKHFQGS